MENNVSNLEKEEIKEEDEVKEAVAIENTKCITVKSFPMDINILKAPLFLFNNYKPERNELGKPINQIEEKTYIWVDSKNMNRKLRMYCKGRLPRQFESDTFHGLVGLFIKKHAPFPFNYETKQYEINVSKLEFSWYELCDFMNIPSTGYYIDRLKEAVRILKQTQYFSYENGVIYDRSNQKYLQSGEEGMSLISKYKFKTNKKVALNDEYATEINSNFVIFDELILNNLRYEYLKFLDVEMFFNRIPSGIGRGIYGYLEANRYDNNGKPLMYVKRSYEALKVGIPVEFNYPYEIKNKLEKPLKHKMKIGYLKDFAFGDEIMINGKKESCVYFCFGITASELKNMLERKKIVEQIQFDFEDNDDEVAIGVVSNSEKEYLKLPTKPLVDELIERKVDTKFAHDIVSKKDKWFIIKHILWLDKQMSTGKVGETGALLSFALRRENGIDIKNNQYQDIYDFIENEKLKEKLTRKDSVNKLKEEYDKYVSQNISDFKETQDYQLFKEVLLSDMNSNIDRMIKQNKAINNDVSKLEEFKLLQEKSAYFEEQITKEIKVMKKIMTEQEFKNQKINDKE